jgi:hypothetical protein
MPHARRAPTPACRNAALRRAGTNHENGLRVMVRVKEPVSNDEQWTMNKKENTRFIVYRLTFIVPK